MTHINAGFEASVCIMNIVCQRCLDDQRNKGHIKN